MNEGFAAVPNWMVRESELSVYALTVYLALASHSGRGGIWPSYEVLAKEARCSERKVSEALRELQGLGVVEVVRRKSSAGRASNGYVLKPNGRVSAVAEVPAPRADTGGGSGTTCGLVPAPRAEEEEPIKKINTRARVESLIDEGWWPSEALVAWAAVEAPGVNVARESAAFVDYFVGEGRKHKDWDRAWKNWMRRAQSTAERFGWKPADADVVQLENATQVRLAREAAEQKRAWCAAHGVTVEEFDRRHREPGFLASLGVGRG